MAEYLFKTDKINACKDCPCAAATDPSYFIWCRLVLEPNTSVEGGMMWKYIDKKDRPKPSWCPLVEVQTHGDLKDFNDIVSTFDKVIHDVDDDTNALLADLLVKIGYAPTVIEAKDDCDCTAPDCLDCERNDACNSIGIERLWEDNNE